MRFAGAGYTRSISEGISIHTNRAVICQWNIQSFHFLPTPVVSLSGLRLKNESDLLDESLFNFQVS